MRNLRSLLTKEIAESKRTKPAETHTIQERGQLYGIGGWLLFFCVSLTIISPAAIVYFTAKSVIVSGRALAGNEMFQLVNTALVVYGVIVGITLWRTRRGAVRQIKVFLLVNAAVACIEAILGTALGLQPPVGVVGYIAEILYLGLWLLYFSNSRRVANTFPKTRS